MTQRSRAGTRGQALFIGAAYTAHYASYMDRPASDSAPERLRTLPSWLLSQTAVPAHRLVSQRLAAVGARGYHFRLLAALDDFGAASQATLGRRSGIHLSDVVAAVNELAEGGFVRRSPDPSDRRRNVITITEAGRQRLRELADVLATVQDELLAPFSVPEREELVRLLTVLLEHHGRG
ncbi:transcriptional regulator [Saccharomonospora marina XMU15]|uniref:Transcriptional regulator n=2 Tax=Saccharomonospora TaxID=1851 RepID=H5X2I7_9PSEU|nr:transcriptional regulator [Saccharomonospora marina XMU15]